MILTAHQPAYLPWLGLFHKIALADVFVFMDDVKYSKSDYSNRNFIKHPAGKKHFLTVPLKTGGSDNVTFRELRIDNDQPWQHKHLASIQNFYRQAPHLGENSDLFRFYEHKYELHADLTYQMLLYFLEKLKISTRVFRSSALGLQASRNDYLIELCKRVECDTYVFGAMGRDYADLDAFNGHGIRPVFQQYQHPVYPQQHGAFISHLSIVDLLLNCGEASCEIVMSGNLAKENIYRVDSASVVRECEEEITL